MNKKYRATIERHDVDYPGEVAYRWEQVDSRDEALEIVRKDNEGAEFFTYRLKYLRKNKEKQ